MPSCVRRERTSLSCSVLTTGDTHGQQTESGADSRAQVNITGEGREVSVRQSLSQSTNVCLERNVIELLDETFLNIHIKLIASATKVCPIISGMNDHCVISGSNIDHC